MKKKGMEISINFLVMIIISLVVFIFGMVFAFRFFGQAEDYKSKVDQDTRREIESLVIGQGGKVAAYPTQIQLNSGKNEIIGVGVASIGQEFEKTFSLNISCVKYITNSEALGGEGNCSKITILYTPTDISLTPNADYIYAIYIKNNNAPLGTYIINARVTAEGIGQYGEIQKIYVKSI